MAEFYLEMALFLLLNLLTGLVRVFRGPTLVDRMLTVQLFGTTAVAILMLLAEGLAAPALRDVALLFALLAALSSVAFVRLAPPAHASKEDQP
jgi:multicomponent Na+:H+ antiporter subunit F